MGSSRFGSYSDNPELDVLWRDLVGSSVDVVLSGGERAYERFHRLDASGAPALDGGTRLLIAGTGGADIFDTLRSLESEFQNTTDHGILNLRLRPGAYS